MCVVAGVDVVISLPAEVPVMKCLLIMIEAVAPKTTTPAIAAAILDLLHHVDAVIPSFRHPAEVENAP